MKRRYSKWKGSYISLPNWYAECNSKVTRVRAAWEKFHEYLLMLNRKGFSLNEKVNYAPAA